MLRTIEGLWKEAFSLAWESYRMGSIPIGCVIADETGGILSRGRNRVGEEGAFPNRRVAHAELDAILSYDPKAHPEPKKATVLSTMEPCPMCFGMIVMANFRRLRFAALDGWAGVCLCPEQSGYVRGKGMDVTAMGGHLQTLQLALQTAWLLERGDRADGPILTKMREAAPDGVVLGQALHEEGTLRRLRAAGASFDETYAALEPRLGGAVPALRAAEPMEVIGRTVRAVMDRPLGTPHPRYPSLVYRLNYGYVPGVAGGDGAEQDVYVLGVDRPLREFTGEVVGVFRRLDDCEEKWLLAPAGVSFTREEMLRATYFVEQFFQPILYT